MMKRAERDSVSDLVRASCPMPPDVRRIESDRHVVQAHAEIAYRASIVIGLEHRLAEPRIAMHAA